MTEALTTAVGLTMDQLWQRWDVIKISGTSPELNGLRVITRVNGCEFNLRPYRRWIDPWWLWLCRRFRP